MDLHVISSNEIVGLDSSDTFSLVQTFAVEVLDDYLIQSIDLRVQLFH